MQILNEAVYRYHEQTSHVVKDFFSPDEVEFMASIGCTPHEMFAYVKDYATLGDPSPSTILLIAAMRRVFFMKELRGKAGTTALLKESEMPREWEKFHDIAYLPRIICKADAKLHGTLPQNVMYYCAKDREFLRSHGAIPPEDFLDVVWKARGDKQKVVSYVLRLMKENGDDLPGSQAQG